MFFSGGEALALHYVIETGFHTKRLIELDGFDSNSMISLFMSFSRPKKQTDTFQGLGTLDSRPEAVPSRSELLT